LKEGGDLAIPLKAGLITEAAIKGDLHDLARGRHKGRITADDITLFKSVGTAIEDFAAARLAMERLQAR
ncbi:MAG: ornithine cyclodeaminase family protein, partial [Dongiaceae bacterium]